MGNGRVLTTPPATRNQLSDCCPKQRWEVDKYIFSGGAPVTALRRHLATLSSDKKAPAGSIVPEMPAKSSTRVNKDTVTGECPKNDLWNAGKAGKVLRRAPFWLRPISHAWAFIANCHASNI